MAAGERAQQRMGRQLRDAIEHLRADIDRVEFWADAIDGMAQPVPDYQQTKGNLNEFKLQKPKDVRECGDESASDEQCTSAIPARE